MYVSKLNYEKRNKMIVVASEEDIFKIISLDVRYFKDRYSIFETLTLKVENHLKSFQIKLISFN